MLSSRHYSCAVDTTRASSKPLAILDYNKYKAGVDTMDQMVANYTSKRATNRWPLAVFYNMLDIAGLASYIIYDSFGTSKKSDRRRSFLIELARQLVAKHMEERATDPLVTRFTHIKQAMAVFNVSR